mmetsp:Transcript_9827/g.25829  ORF Transcript_9827/g.25829 Transcript_9827/m.25829 type:complete len:184 (+) Transcript_9827:84-635(+)|eukprot:CAMPEP_0117523348 /NCGR_PEP_ID=MMETSP0784-20121206/34683_1 /TAXON_ID=39447 /ORGANISM="" /LENGTH=183 /DNA_ID=CAMNT_0005319461 /DNA_START=79 /DNA_END=630 /DNA_ORIENTATION=+
MESARSYELVEDGDEGAKFVEWLSADDESVVADVDGGSFGRPVSIGGVREGYMQIDRRFDERFPWRQGVVKSISSFYLGKCGVPIGHIDCLIVDSPPMGGLVGWIFFVYIVPEDRGQGAGKAMVELATKSFPSGMSVYCTVVQSNVRAKKFYEALSFLCVSTHELPGGFTIDLMEKRSSADDS